MATFTRLGSTGHITPLGYPGRVTHLGSEEHPMHGHSSSHGGGHKTHRPARRASPPAHRRTPKRKHGLIHFVAFWLLVYALWSIVFGDMGILPTGWITVVGLYFVVHWSGKPRHNRVTSGHAAHSVSE